MDDRGQYFLKKQTINFCACSEASPWGGKADLHAASWGVSIFFFHWRAPRAEPEPPPPCRNSSGSSWGNQRSGRAENSCFFAVEVHCKPRLPGVRAAVFTQLYSLTYLEIVIQFGYKQTLTLSEFRQGQKPSPEHSLSEWGQSLESWEEENPFQVALGDTYNTDGSN